MQGPTLQYRSDGTYALTFASGEVHTFSSSGRITRFADRNGNGATIAYGANARPISLTSDTGEVVNITTNGSGLITALSDSLGTIATYTYNWFPALTKVVYADQSGFNFTYSPVSGYYSLMEVDDLLWNVLEKHTYDTQGRALTSERANGVDKYTLAYVNETQTNVTDGLGRVTKYFFEKVRPAQPITWRNRVVRTEGPCGCGGSDVTAWTYNDNGHVASRTDALGRTETFSYDSAGNLTVRTRPDGTVTSYVFGPFNKLTSLTDALGNVTTFERDVRGNLAAMTDPLSNRWSMTYDQRGLPLTATSPRQATTTLEYDGAGELVAVEDALDNRRTFTHDVRGRRITGTDAAGQVTSYAYDAAGRLAKVTSPDGSAVTYQRDLAGRLTKVIDGRGNATTYTYDDAYRLTRVTDALGQITRYAYDVMSRLTSSTDPLSRVTTYAYDDHDRLLRITHPPAAAGVAAIVETFTYDLTGNLLERVDGAGGHETYGYDASDRLTSVTDGAGRITRYEHDVLGRLTAVVDPAGQRQEFTYDARSALTSIVRGQGRSMLYEYDQDGNRTVRQSFDGTRTVYAFDLLDRLTAVRDSGGNTLASYGYDAEGRLTSAQNAAASLTYGYDGLGRVISATDGAGTTVSYQYDGNGNRTSMQVGTDRTVTYGYNAIDLPTQIVDRGQAISFAYDAADARTRRTLPNGIVSTYGYDGLGRSKSITHGSAMSLAFDRNGRHDLTSLSGADGQQSFQYDAAGWLSAASRDGVETERYSYDPAGNRASSHLASLYNYQSSNQLVSAAPVQFTYDANGNVATRTDATGSYQFAWDREDRLLEVALPDGRHVAYSYDALGRRRERSLSTGQRQRYVYDGLDAILEVAQDGTRREYLNGLGIDEHLLHRENGVATYYLENHQGSVVALASNTGAILERLTYDSFGRGAGSTRTRFDYTGRERDPLTGLLEYRARWYDPSVGRFMSEDPLGIEGGINLYLYVGNNPLNLTDPLGLRPLADEIVDTTAGWGDTLSGGLTRRLRELLGIDDVVDPCSTGYKAGEVIGVVNSTLMGAGGGLRAAGAKAAGKEFSHWIPNRILKKAPDLVKKFVNKTFGRSRLNGNYVSSYEHYLHDSYRQLKGGRAVWGARLPPLQQQVDRIPRALDAGLTGMIWGLIGAHVNSCECK